MSNAMKSRSVRLSENTLKDLQIMADEVGIGITVYIRKILEEYVTAYNVSRDPGMLTITMGPHD